MQLTKANVKKVIEDNFDEHIDMDFVGIKKDGDGFIALSKPQGLNAGINNLDKWEDRLITHIKWQLQI